jgi:hypothetical protein
VRFPGAALCGHRAFVVDWGNCTTVNYEGTMLEATINELQAAMSAGSCDARWLTRMYWTASLSTVQARTSIHS